MVDLPALGARIQAIRADRGLSLQRLADSSAVSVSMLSSVERGEKAATIVVLGRIAEGLGVPLARLVAPASESTVVVRRAADQDVADEPGGWRRTVLSPVVPGVNFEWVRTELPPGCDAGVFPAYAPGSHEFVAVDAGTLRLTVGGEATDLGPGDSVYFAADVEHGYANPGTEPCRYAVAALIMRPRGPGAARPRRRPVG
ncbi:helix-turn-helix domain-containing protein [Nocardiopsis trehalosi]|uniref:helix-turn-helix domain-containing protein n=1 Tax=Nocardiopsis trehalosi TaxID=109329 RepID=UPI00082D9D70|nr:XRE family transcriptional regulator [Nocardiopsis trehalosi]